MSANFALVAGDIVFGGAVFVIRDGRFNFSVSVGFMLVDQCDELFIFTGVAGSRLHCRDDAARVIHRAMVMIARPRRFVALAPEGCVRIGCAHHSVINRIVVFWDWALLQFTFLRLVSLLKSRDQLGRGAHHRVIGSVGIDQTRIDMELAAIDQTGLNALRDRAREKLFEGFLAPTRARLAQDTVIGNLIVQSVA